MSDIETCTQPYNQLRQALLDAHSICIAKIKGWNKESTLELWSVPKLPENRPHVVIVQRWKNGGFDVYKQHEGLITSDAIAYALGLPVKS